MKKGSKLIQYLKDPHTKKVQHFKERYQELDELSEVAVQIGDALAYKSLQTEMKEVFFDYLTAVVVDSIYKIAPHVLIIWIISLKWPYITIPIVNWQIDIFGAYLVGYLLFYGGKWLVKPIKSWLHKLGLIDFRASQVTKI
ncbi:hypothetical protein [Desulfosporosinus hippei]|uniref:Holin of 3TMs, for gene-transfer release n=1 Tax=Desulfosporosinus hippei DSM 8344 TaxID=1121419 RepID=A0A1G8LUZ1_9FIRM|nr:hypothetical protein [Desulfosporosinus hippei]SDI58990.1 hypothetical protein SAMN05443529_15419 [Desulfosporosinus hippei DSM 8344]